MPFQSFCDEFGHPDDPNKRIMGIAGLLASANSWVVLQENWEQLQRDEGIPNPFHMTDFVHRAKAFTQGWETQRRLKILTSLLQVIKNARVIPIAATVILNDFNALRPEQRAKLKNAYHVAFEQVSYQIAFATAMSALALPDLNPFQHTVLMVYAKAKKYTGPAEQHWNAIKKFNPHIGHFMASYSAADPAEHAGLQAADIWAYSLGHVHEHHPAKNSEAAMAYQFFLGEATKQALGHSFYEVFDHHKLLMRLGELPE